MLHPCRRGARILFMTTILVGLWARHADSGEPDTPLFSFGVVADVQYADKPTVGKRHYQQSARLLADCVRDLKKQELAFTIQLGDLVDGNTTPQRTRADLDRVLEIFQPLAGRLHHVVGNHCLNAGREYVLEKYGLAQGYYDFVPPGVAEWRMVVLDGNDAGYGRIGPQQLDWLRGTLARAQRQGERVLLFCHYAVATEAAAHHRLNDREPIEAILGSTRCVVAYVAGHDHEGGYAQKAGVHHITIQGMVEASPQNAYAIVHVYQDRLELEGVGAVPSRKLALGEASVKQ